MGITSSFSGQPVQPFDWLKAGALLSDSIANARRLAEQQHQFDVEKDQKMFENDIASGQPQANIKAKEKEYMAAIARQQRLDINDPRVQEMYNQLATQMSTPKEKQQVTAGNYIEYGNGVQDQPNQVPDTGKVPPAPLPPVSPEQPQSVNGQVTGSTQVNQQIITGGALPYESSNGVVGFKDLLQKNNQAFDYTNGIVKVQDGMQTRGLGENDLRALYKDYLDSGKSASDYVSLAATSPNWALKRAGVDTTGSISVLDMTPEQTAFALNTKLNEAPAENRSLNFSNRTIVSDNQDLGKITNGIFTPTENTVKADPNTVLEQLMGAVSGKQGMTVWGDVKDPRSKEQFKNIMWLMNKDAYMKSNPGMSESMARDKYLGLTADSTPEYMKPGANVIVARPLDLTDTDVAKASNLPPAQANNIQTKEAGILDATNELSKLDPKDFASIVQWYKNRGSSNNPVPKFKDANWAIKNYNYIMQNDGYLTRTLGDPNDPKFKDKWDAFTRQEQNKIVNMQALGMWPGSGTADNKNDIALLNTLVKAQDVMSKDENSDAARAQRLQELAMRLGSKNGSNAPLQLRLKQLQDYKAKFKDRINWTDAKWYAEDSLYKDNWDLLQMDLARLDNPGVSDEELKKKLITRSVQYGGTGLPWGGYIEGTQKNVQIPEYNGMSNGQTTSQDNTVAPNTTVPNAGSQPTVKDSAALEEFYKNNPNLRPR
jgi:hypothetical protein